VRFFSGKNGQESEGKMKSKKREMDPEEQKIRHSSVAYRRETAIEALDFLACLITSSCCCIFD
jgi:hypothetical protein